MGARERGQAKARPSRHDASRVILIASGHVLIGFQLGAPGVERINSRPLRGEPANGQARGQRSEQGLLAPD